ncbi:hypothetical protein APHAL10511_006713 [Amanita phalloides]|nr:hypothetical protein APHAL10511_006713 [Amanita phalloides]
MSDVQLSFANSDPALSYSQGWDSGSTAQPGAQADIAFNGSFITLFASLPARSDAPDPYSSASFSIDDTQPSYFNTSLSSYAIPNQPIFQPSAILQDGPHLLRIVNGNGFLDLNYFTITPPASPQLVKYDDSDPFIQYSGPWSTNSSASQLDYLSTLHNASSSKANLSFSFSGSFIAVYGIYHPGPLPNVSFTIDDSTSTPLANPPLPITKTIHQAVLFQSSSLRDANHALSIRFGDNNQGVFSLDYLLVYSPSPTPSSGSNDTSPSKSSSVAPGVIAGAVLGSVAIFIIIIFLIFFGDQLFRAAFTRRTGNNGKHRSVLSLQSRRYRSPLSPTSPSGEQEDRRTYYVDGSGRPLRLFNETRSRSSLAGTPTPNVVLNAPRRARSRSPNASASDPCILLPRYPPLPRSERDAEAATLRNEDVGSSPAAMADASYGHDEKFAMFGQL